ncbi:BrnT family toxin [Hoeflea olei]|uniref:BrnT family toxin n=1 Tax=Hoeflea olei TaxID=1480615 RepID=A0A1C1YVL4_9HYPH|nr:BrnT family toxin [Hoeflea olei]OCW57578.1 hypothetical protein AWJ14_01795 [Hoeflea olei]
MKIVWDEPKRRANLNKHGFDFAEVAELDWHTAIVEDGRPDADGRQRFKAIGTFRDSTVVVFAILGSEAISIISFRAASDKERRRLRWPPEAKP